MRRVDAAATITNRVCLHLLLLATLSLPLVSSATPNRTTTPTSTTIPSESASTSDATDTETMTFSDSLAVTRTPTRLATATRSPLSPTISASETKTPFPQPCLIATPTEIVQSVISQTPSAPSNDRTITLQVMGTTFDIKNAERQPVRVEAYFFSRITAHSNHTEKAGFNNTKGSLLTQESVVGINRTHLQLVLHTVRRYYTARPEIVELRLADDCFTSRSAVLPAVFTIGIPQRQAVSKAVAQSAGVVAVVASLLGGTAMLSGATAAQAARTLSLLSLDECEYSYNERLPWASYPIGVPISDEVDVRYYMGQMVFNPVLLVAITFIHFWLAHLASEVKKVTLRQGMAMLRFPSMSFLPTVFLMQDSVTAIIVVFFHASQPLSMMIGMIMLIFWVAVGVGCIVITRVKFSGVSFMALDPKLERSTPVLEFLFGCGSWKDAAARKKKPPTTAEDEIASSQAADESIHQKRKPFCFLFGSMFHSYGPDRHWFITIELLTILATAVAVGVQPDFGDCRNVSIAMTAILGLYALCVIGLRPYFVPFTQAFNVAFSVLQFSGSLFLTLSSVERMSFLKTVGVVLVVGSMYLAGVKAITEVCLLLAETVFAVRIEKRRRRVPSPWDDGSGSEFEEEGAPPDSFADPLLKNETSDGAAVRPKSSSTTVNIPSRQPTRHDGKRRTEKASSSFDFDVWYTAEAEKKKKKKEAAAAHGGATSRRQPRGGEDRRRFEKDDDDDDDDRRGHRLPRPSPPPYIPLAQGRQPTYSRYRNDDDVEDDDDL